MFVCIIYIHLKNRQMSRQIFKKKNINKARYQGMKNLIKIIEKEKCREKEKRIRSKLDSILDRKK